MVKKQNNSVEVEVSPSYVNILVNGIIHIQVPYFKKFVVGTWKQGKNWYVITISDKKGRLLHEAWYKDKQLWTDILTKWKENIY